MYLEAKKEAKQVVRKARNEEWIKVGESLQIDFVNNQRNFWRMIKATVKGSLQQGEYVMRMGRLSVRRTR